MAMASNSATPSTGRNTRFRWQMISTRNPKATVTRPARPDYAKEDLRRFVHENQLQYRQRRDDFTEFEDLFSQLRLNEDEELLDRAERRDLPASVQLAARKTAASESRNNLRAAPDVTDIFAVQRPPNRALPKRRSAMPDTMYDDYAYRRYNQGSELRTSQKHKRRPIVDPVDYLSLVSYDDCSTGRSPCPECIYCDGTLDHPPDEACPMRHLHRYPDLVADDVLNRRIRQSPAARTPAPQPPFGIPNSPVSSFIHTFPQSDYSRVEPDQGELRRRYRIREPEPHLVHDDLAFRSLRKDYHLGYKLSDDDFWQGQLLARSASTSDLAFKDFRSSLRPTAKPSSLASSSASNSSSSPSAAASPTFDSSLPRVPLPTESHELVL